MDAKPTSTYERFKLLGISGFSAVVAETITLPLDSAKVRLQLRNRSAAHVPQSGAPKGSIATMRHIYRTEGAGALFMGLEAGIHRQMIFTGVRVGLYGTILDEITGHKPRKEAEVYQRTAAALCTSAIGITLANPSDVAKVRTQAWAFQKAERGGASVATKSVDALYRGSVSGLYRNIIVKEGMVGGLYAGYPPNLIRNSIISAAELVTYDVSKRKYIALGLPEGVLLHAVSGLTAGLIATMLGNPWDVVSTRIMVNREKGDSRGMIATSKDMILKEGLFSFYQGVIPNFLRIGGFNIVLWVVHEQVSRLFG